MTVSHYPISLQDPYLSQPLARVRRNMFPIGEHSSEIPLMSLLTHGKLLQLFHPLPHSLLVAPQSALRWWMFAAIPNQLVTRMMSPTPIGYSPTVSKKRRGCAETSVEGFSPLLSGPNLIRSVCWIQTTKTIPATQGTRTRWSASQSTSRATPSHRRYRN